MFTKIKDAPELRKVCKPSFDKKCCKVSNIHKIYNGYAVTNIDVTSAIISCFYEFCLLQTKTLLTHKILQHGAAAFVCDEWFVKNKNAYKE